MPKVSFSDGFTSTTVFHSNYALYICVGTALSWGGVSKEPIMAISVATEDFTI